MIQFQPFSTQESQSHQEPSPHKRSNCTQDPIVIVGAGLAGLFAALKFSEMSSLPVVLLSPAKIGDNSASAWAQGGIAAAVGADDSAQFHAEDTIAAGAGLNDSDAVLAICQAAAAHIDKLDAYGVPFDRQENFQPETNSQTVPTQKTLKQPYALSREAAHRTKRVVRCVGDSSGRAIMATLIAAVERQPQITVLEGVIAHRLLQNKGSHRICGVSYHQAGQESGQAQHLQARAVILACGGIGALYEATTNPPSAQGQGLGIALLAGAVLADIEFVQFHPTALDLPEQPQPLASEALRGEGAILLDAAGKRFMLGDPDAQASATHAELAPRDIVARAVFRARRNSGAAYLDCRHLCSSSTEFSRRFPILWQSTQRHGLDPHSDLLPVIPAAHYHMGGIATDLRGRSSVPSLWAIGEVACTGLHGANRLASNSLLEAVVMASKAAEDVLNCLSSTESLADYQHNSKPDPSSTNGTTTHLPLPPTAAPVLPLTSAFGLQSVMSQYVGVERSTAGLLYALQELLRHCPSELSDLGGFVPHDPDKHGDQLVQDFELQLADGNNALVAALAITCAALLRSESRGSHYYLGNLPRPALTPELEILLQKYSSNTKRSFLNWTTICQILQEVRKQPHQAE